MHTNVQENRDNRTAVYNIITDVPIIFVCRSTDVTSGFP